MQQLEQIYRELEPKMIDCLSRWVRCGSVKTEAENNAPFGRDVAKMLDLALEDCEKLGFKTKNVDYYAGHADLGEGSDEDALAILAHVDVVPVGSGWTKEPFGAEIAGDKMFGRGTIDDKGPAVAALFAMKAVDMLGLKLKRKVRLILGCDEESGWECMKYYKAHETMPKSGFTPDADFPVINIEKGMLGLSLKARQVDEGLNIIAIDAGERTNVIPGEARATLKNEKGLEEKIALALKKHDIRAEYSVSGDEIGLKVYGKGGHAAYPEKADNAIGRLLILLKELGAKGAVLNLADRIKNEHDGKSLGIKLSDVQSGELTLNLGILKMKNSEIFATLDLRCPILANLDKIVEVIRQGLSSFEVSVNSKTEPHYVAESSELVSELLNAYHEETGLEKKALAIGGGTYAKALEEGVAFGMAFPGDVELAHQPDEFVELEKLKLAMRVYANAIIRLACEK